MVLYFSNQFPSPVEPYVADEVLELRQRGFDAVVCSMKRPVIEATGDTAETLYLWPLQLRLMLRALIFVFHPFIRKLLLRVFFREKENLSKRFRAILHTWLGAYCALLLRHKDVEHIHIHHGYFAAWVGMVAAKLMGTGYSITLHGSDLLLHAAYLDVKLENCKICFTVSNFNRDYLLKHYPQISESKVIVSRMGVNLPASRSLPRSPRATNESLRILSVGRLHPVKDHAFLIEACRVLKNRGCNFFCAIAGEGPERKTLEKMIRTLNLQEEVLLVGHVSNVQLDDYYAEADLVVLTSRSEGIPLALMEAMARKKIVLAPRITGIPELIINGKNGFLFERGSLTDFVRSVEMISYSLEQLAPIGKAAREHVSEHFNKKTTISRFVKLLIAQARGSGEVQDEDPVLQQI
jgi:glycosyltransferase involved in cell wall biosynthesis